MSTLQRATWYADSVYKNGRVRGHYVRLECGCTKFVRAGKIPKRARCYADTAKGWHYIKTCDRSKKP